MAALRTGQRLMQLPVGVFAIAIAFWWSVKSGQFDDLEGPGFKVLMDDDGPNIPGPGGSKKGESEKV